MSSSKKEFVGAAAFYAQHHWAAIQSAGSTDAFAGREHDSILYPLLLILPKLPTANRSSKSLYLRTASGSSKFVDMRPKFCCLIAPRSIYCARFEPVIPSLLSLKTE